MQYLLGLISGIILCLIYGNYLLRQRKKEQKKELDRMVDLWVRTFHSSSSPSLEQQLQEALSREDFETAARLRDLINKK